MNSDAGQNASFYFPEEDLDLLSYLKEAALRSNRSRSYILREAIAADRDRRTRLIKRGYFDG